MVSSNLLLSFLTSVSSMGPFYGSFQCWSWTKIIHRQNSLEWTFCVRKSLSRVQLFEIPWTIAHQALLAMGFARKEYWSGLPFPSLQGIFPTQGWKPGLLHCRPILYHLSYREAFYGDFGKGPRISSFYLRSYICKCFMFIINPRWVTLIISCFKYYCVSRSVESNSLWPHGL